MVLYEIYLIKLKKVPGLKQSFKPDIIMSTSTSSKPGKFTRIRSVTFHPVTSNGVSVDFPVKLEVSFNRNADGEPKDTFSYVHDPINPTTVTFTEEFYLIINQYGGSDIRGKLWAFDRQTSDCYFTLYPSSVLEQGGDVHVRVSAQGPAIVFILSVSSE